jgi:hypothetical protein
MASVGAVDNRGDPLASDQEDLLQRSRSEPLPNRPAFRLGSPTPFPAFRERAVAHSIPATLPFAFERSRSSSPSAKPVSWLERHVGEMVAGAAGNLALALSEFQDRGLTTHTKMAGGDAIFQLFRLRQMMVGTWDFDRIAREHGRAVLRETCGADIDARTIDMLVDAVLEILAKVVRDQLN